MDINQQKLLESPRVEKLAALFLLIASVFVALIAINQVRGFFEPHASVGNMITVSGEGKVTAIPDIATIDFTVSADGDNASSAQDTVTKKTNVALALLTGDKIADTDVQTTSYNISPKYAYQPPCYGGAYCPPQTGQVVGYTVSQSVEVKVRDTSQVGTVLSQLGDAGVSNISGPNFTIDNIEAVQAQARAKAIADAKAQAQALAKDLGVSLVQVTGYNENGGPIYYARGVSVTSDSVAPSAATPSVPAGENDVTVDVTVSYEIR